MELIVTDSSWNEVGILSYESGDFAYGASENSFALKISNDQEIPDDYIANDYLIYSENGEVGGVLRGVKLAENGSITLTGVTWSGLIGEHIVTPEPATAYYTVSGEITSAVETLIEHLGLSDVIEVSGNTSIMVSHTFIGDSGGSVSDSSRYMNGWSALWQLLYVNGCKVTFTFDASNKKILLYVSALDEYLDDETLTVIPSKISATVNRPPNHLICLGSGEGDARMVRHLYADEQGVVSTTQTYFGADEIVKVFDASGASNATELVTEGTAKLELLLVEAQSLDVHVPENINYDLGDLVGAMDERTGFYASAIISKKIVRISDGVVTREYSTTVGL